MCFLSKTIISIDIVLFEYSVYKTVCKTVYVKQCM